MKLFTAFYNNDKYSSDSDIYNYDNDDVITHTDDVCCDHEL